MGRHGVAITIYNRDSSERLAVKRLLAAVGGRNKQQQQQQQHKGQQQVLRRRIDSAKLEVIAKEVSREVCCCSFARVVSVSFQVSPSNCLCLSFTFCFVF